MSTATEERLDVAHSEVDASEQRVAHIVYPYVAFTEALVAGTPVTALCGYTWIPTRNGGGLPVCAPCVREKARMTGGSFGEAA